MCTSHSLSSYSFPFSLLPSCGAVLRERRKDEVERKKRAKLEKKPGGAGDDLMKHRPCIRTRQQGEYRGISAFVCHMTPCMSKPPSSFFQVRIFASFFLSPFQHHLHLLPPLLPLILHSYPFCLYADTLYMYDCVNSAWVPNPLWRHRVSGWVYCCLFRCCWFISRHRLLYPQKRIPKSREKKVSLKKDRVFHLAQASKHILLFFLWFV